MSAYVADWAGLEEAERVYYWRVCRLLDLGFGMDKAEEVAASDADVHAVEHLVLGAGCAPELAAAILT